ncbi:MAG: hypothetical protein ACE5MK_08990 [Acidobacteriota bacterium]
MKRLLLTTTLVCIATPAIALSLICKPSTTTFCAAVACEEAGDPFPIAVGARLEEHEYFRCDVAPNGDFTNCDVFSAAIDWSGRDIVNVSANRGSMLKLLRANGQWGFLEVVSDNVKVWIHFGACQSLEN